MTFHKEDVMGPRFCPWTQSILWQYRQSVQKQAGGFFINPVESPSLPKTFIDRDAVQMRSDSKIRIPKTSRKLMRYRREREMHIQVFLGNSLWALCPSRGYTHRDLGREEANYWNTLRYQLTKKQDKHWWIFFFS